MKNKMSLQSLAVMVVFMQLTAIGLCQDSPKGSLPKKVKRYIGWMLDKNKPDVWVAASRLEKLGKNAVPLIKRQMVALPDEIAQVACAKVLIKMDEAAYGMEFLLDIIEKGKNQQAKLHAISLVGIYGDFELEDRLSQILESTLNPYVKIAMAKALWQVARNPQATKALKAYLGSDNTEIRYTAALALGEIHNVEAAKPVLFKLKDEPSFRGRLARSLLEQETLINRYERLLDSQGGVTKVAPKPKYPIVEEILQKIKQYHVEGDKLSTLELLDAAVKGMVSSSDTHSAFWTEKEWSEFMDKAIHEEYVGIGVYVGDRDGYFTVIAPIYSGPA